MVGRRFLPLFACAWLAPLHAAPLDVAWFRDGALTAVSIPAPGQAAAQTASFDGARKVPLGSLWKLFVYVHAVDRKLPMPDYACTGQQPQEEVYCCARGESVERDAALAQSCSLFFSPKRLMVQQRPWRDYWTERLGRAPDGELAWLSDPAQLEPGRLVTLQSLFTVLASIPAAQRKEAETALLRVALGARGNSTVGALGSRLRVKTYSWHAPGRAGTRLGGAAGWLADGTPVWFGGEGTSQAVLQKWSGQLAATLPQVQAQRDNGCVVVDYFKRYPLRSVVSAGKEGKLATPGLLHGAFAVQFENGSSLSLRSAGELLLGRDERQRPILSGRFGVNEYVARVVDREGGTAQPEAAKALAIAARTYLQQNAGTEQGCQRIADSSATQRVSPNPATAAARAVAQWTDQLVLSGVDVRYHADTAGKNVMAWTQAVSMAQAGKRFDEILAQAYPSADLATLNGGTEQCKRLDQAEAWMARELGRWERVLRTEAGYERPAEPPSVCRLAAGTPYSEQSRNRIFVRGWSTREDRITLAHEYLHLGLRHHPRGQDERLVEQLARRLVDQQIDAH